MPILAILALVGIAAAILYEAGKAAIPSASNTPTDTPTDESSGVVGTVEELFVNKPSQPQIDFAQAIAFGEGGIDANGDPTTNLPGRINNPGDLEIGDIGNGVQAGKTIFSAADPEAEISKTADDGWSRLYHQVWLIASGNSHFTLNMTFADFAAFYVNGAVSKATADSTNWARNVTSYLQQKGYSVTPGSTLGEVLNA